MHNRLSPQHASSSAHSRHSQAPAHSAAGRRYAQRTTEVQRRQLRHLCETRCQRRCPSIFDPIACMHRRPSARPSQKPHHPRQPRSQPLQPAARSIIHHPCIAGIRKHPPTAQLRRCTQRTSEAQRRQLRHPSETRCQRRCPSIFDPIACTHRRPSARPSQNPHHPRAATLTTAPARSTQHHPSSMHCRHSQAPAHSAAAPMHAAYL